MNVKKVIEYNQQEYSSIISLIETAFGLQCSVSTQDYMSMIGSANNHLFVIAEGNKVVATLTLIIYRTFTGKLKGYVEDVAVSPECRGLGLGKKIVLHALNYAQSLGAMSVTLSSSPKKVVANAMYLSIGFELRQTNLYNYNLSQLTVCSK